MRIRGFKGRVVDYLPTIVFPENNEIRYRQDFQGKVGVPSVELIPAERLTNSIVFIGNNNGITADDREALSIDGEYGDGCIYVSISDLPDGVYDWCAKVIKNKLPKRVSKYKSI